jgi:hypothetical protein
MLGNSARPLADGAIAVRRRYRPQIEVIGRQMEVRENQIARMFGCLNGNRPHVQIRGSCDDRMVAEFDCSHK